MRATPTLALAATLTLASACADHAPTGPTQLAASTASRDVSSVWSSIKTGETGPGAQYAFYMPSAWNGDVVYYAHGIRPASDPVDLPTGDGFPAFRDAMGAQGFSVAYSSFSENGWAVKDGAQRTHQLRGLFTSAFSKPRRSFLAGTSMGGLVAQKLAEDFPSQYDGTLAMCAPLAGATAEVSYIANVRVLFDVFYPGVLPGDVLHVPAGLNLYTDVLGPAQAAIIASPTGAGIIARIAQTPIAGNNGPELVGSILYALAYDISGIDDFLGRTHGHSMFDNSARPYYSAAAPGLLPPSLVDYINAAAGKFTATPDAAHYLANYYNPSGTLSTPTVTLHTTRDPLVPIFHEGAFAQAAASTGSSANLLQRSVDGYGHCAFSTSEMMDAMNALAGWVRSGVRPAA